MLKVFSLFLIVIAVLAMFGKLGWIGKITPKRLRKGRTAPLIKPAICPECGRHIIGKSGCDCKMPAKNG